MVFFLALLPGDETREFLTWAEAHLGKQPAGFRERFGPAVAGLQLAARVNPVGTDDGAAGARRFFGWTTGKHWLLE